MSEYQKCQKCGKTFTRFTKSGPSISKMSDIMRHAKETICPSCGGQVIWVDDNGSPMSAYKRMKEANRHMRIGCLWGIVALIGTACLVLYYLFFK